MSVRYGFTIEIYGFTHIFHTFLARHDAIMRDGLGAVGGQKLTPVLVQRYERWLTTQQKDERQQDNGDGRRLASLHPSDLIRSLTRERDRRTARRLLNHALCFAIFKLSTCSA